MNARETENLGEVTKVVCGPCIVCQNKTEITVATSDFERWQSGEHVQDVWPGMTDMHRETLISGVCSDKCWDELCEGLR